MKDKKPTPNLEKEFFSGEKQNLHVEEPKGSNSIEDLVKKCKIDINEKTTTSPVSMQIQTKGKLTNVFTKGNFSIITGFAKSKKTFLVSMILAAIIKGTHQILVGYPNGGVNILFDTEQSRNKVIQNTKRIFSLCGNNEPNLIVFSLRTLEPVQRLELIDYVLTTIPKINFVAIDGIIDLGNDPITQADESQFITSKLMQWTDELNIHITCVLHYNKSVATLLGHLGSITYRKAESIISVKKDTMDDSISIVENLDSREMPFSSFAFRVGIDGQPYILDDYILEPKAKTKKEQPLKKTTILPSLFTDDIHMKILTNVFKLQREIQYGDLFLSIQNAVAIVTGKQIGDNKAKLFITYYVNKESIIKTGEGSKKAIYSLPGQGEIDF